MADLDFAADLPALPPRRRFRLPAFAGRVIARWTTGSRCRRALGETLQELARLDAATLVDIGILHGARRARWDDGGRSPPRLVVELVYGEDAPAPAQNAMNLWGETLR